jgi:hypothetical protein
MYTIRLIRFTQTPNNISIDREYHVERPGTVYLVVLIDIIFLQSRYFILYTVYY